MTEDDGWDRYEAKEASYDTFNDMDERIEMLRARVSELREALRIFGNHDTGCPGWYRSLPASRQEGCIVLSDPCTCGLDDAIAGPREVKNEP